MNPPNRQPNHVITDLRLLLEPPPIWLVSAVFFVLLNVVLLIAATPAMNDFSHWYYTGALSLHLTGNPYLYSAPEQGLVPYHYPPLLAYLCLPLASADVTAATHLWSGLNVLLTFFLAFQFTTVLLPRDGLTGTTRWRAFPIVLGLLMWYPPQLTGNVLGQTHNLVAIPVMTCLLSLKGGRELRAGMFLAVATLLKIFPGLIVIALLFAKRRRAMVAFIATGLLFSLMTWQQTWHFVSNVLVVGDMSEAAEKASHDGDVRAGQHYISLPAMARRMFTINNFAVPVLESRLCQNLFLVITTLAILTASILLLRCQTSERPSFAALICVSMLVLPQIGFYHLNLALIAASVCYRFILDTCRQRRIAIGSRDHLRQRWMIRCLVIAVLLTAIPVDYGLAPGRPEWLTPLYTLIHTRWGLFLLTPQTYGLLILLSICLRLSRWKEEGEEGTGLPEAARESV